MNYSMFKLLLGRILILVIITISFVLYVTVDHSAGAGFAAGSIAMLLNWRLLAYQNEKIIKENKKPSFAYAFYFLRLSILFIIGFASFVYLKPNGGYLAMAGIVFATLFALVFALLTTKKEDGSHA